MSAERPVTKVRRPGRALHSFSQVHRPQGHRPDNCVAVTHASHRGRSQAIDTAVIVLDLFLFAAQFA